MIDVVTDIELAIEDRAAKRLAAIAALEGFSADTVSFEDYEQAISDYSDALEYVIDLEGVL